jgi:hypothetical protein
VNYSKSYDYNYSSHECLKMEKWRNWNLRGGWARVAAEEKRKQAAVSVHQRELEAEQAKLELLEAEERDAGIRNQHARGWRWALPVAGIGTVLLPVDALLTHSPLLTAGLWASAVLTGIGLELDSARRRAKGLKLRGGERRLAWEAGVGAGCEFGPREPQLGYQLTQADRREVVDEEAGTVRVDFIRRDLEWRAAGWQERRFTVVERVPVGDEAELAGRWFDFCHTLQEENLSRARLVRADEETKETARLELEAKRAQVDSLRGAAERLSVPSAASDYLP